MSSYSDFFTSLPLEVVLFNLLPHISARDFMALRAVNKACSHLFTADEVNEMALFYYFLDAKEIIQRQATKINKCHNGVPLHQLYQEDPSNSALMGAKELFDRIYFRRLHFSRGQPTQYTTLTSTTPPSEHFYLWGSDPRILDQAHLYDSPQQTYFLRPVRINKDFTVEIFDMKSLLPDSNNAKHIGKDPAPLTTISLFKPVPTLQSFRYPAGTGKIYSSSPIFDAWLAPKLAEKRRRYDFNKAFPDGNPIRCVGEGVILLGANICHYWLEASRFSPQFTAGPPPKSFLAAIYLHDSEYAHRNAATMMPGTGATSSHRLKAGDVVQMWHTPHRTPEGTCAINQHYCIYREYVGTRNRLVIVPLAINRNVLGGELRGKRYRWSELDLRTHAQRLDLDEWNARFSVPGYRISNPNYRTNIDTDINVAADRAGKLFYMASECLGKVAIFRVAYPPEPLEQLCMINPVTSIVDELDPVELIAETPATEQVGDIDYGYPHFQFKIEASNYAVSRHSQRSNIGSTFITLTRSSFKWSKNALIRHKITSYRIPLFENSDDATETVKNWISPSDGGVNWVLEAGIKEIFIEPFGVYLQPTFKTVPAPDGQLKFDMETYEGSDGNKMQVAKLFAPRLCDSGLPLDWYIPPGSVPTLGNDQELHFPLWPAETRNSRMGLDDSVPTEATVDIFRQPYSIQLKFDHKYLHPTAKDRKGHSIAIKLPSYPDYFRRQPELERGVPFPNWARNSLVGRVNRTGLLPRSSIIQYGDGWVLCPVQVLIENQRIIEKHKRKQSERIVTLQRIDWMFIGFG